MTKLVIDSSQHDLVTPDGVISELKIIDASHAEACVKIEGIQSNFIGFEIDPDQVFFNIKSVLAQLGINGVGTAYEIDRNHHHAVVVVRLSAIGQIGRTFLKFMTVGMCIGKLFAADERRRVRDPDYLSRMFGRSDRLGRPLLSLGGMQGSDSLILDKVEGRTIAYLALQNGKIAYDESILSFLPTLAKALCSASKICMRDILRLHQVLKVDAPRNIDEDEVLLVKTAPLHIRTVFGRVVENLLSTGYYHTTASILQPDTEASGDIYELFGHSKRELTDIPLEFYTLEPYREHVFFKDRDQLQSQLEDPSALFNAFATAPVPLDRSVSVFLVKGQQMLNLKPQDWIASDIYRHEFPEPFQGSRRSLIVDRYIKHQPSYPFLRAIEDGYITSQGVLLTRYLPSPLMKRILLNDQISRCLKGLYFQYPSLSHGAYFSQEDRALLHDLHSFSLPVYWVDEVTGKILQYIQKPGRESGMFVPVNRIDEYLKATVFGIYGSNLVSGQYEDELTTLFTGILQLRAVSHHPLLHQETPLALVTGGGPGAMEVGNRIAKELGILSCANIADFRYGPGSIIHEQRQNPYVEAKMTYRLKELVERQAEFNLDFPIFVMGGIGTDFELCLEEVRRKVGCITPSPVLLFGEEEYWKSKITGCFQSNRKNGTIHGSEWISNCFYLVKNAQEGLEVYKKYFNGSLLIGRDAPVHDLGFVASFKVTE